MLPTVIFVLLLLNVSLFLAEQYYGNFLITHLALWPLGTSGYASSPAGPVLLPGFQVWQLVTYAFLHGGIAHIFFNMFALWMFGVQVENTWGSQRFAVYYLVCVIGAGLVQLLVASLSHGIYPTIGASGGVFGILLAFGMMFPNQRILLLIPPIPIKAKYFVIGYGLIELITGVTGTEAGVAHFAHLGGMAFGFVLIQYWRGKLPFRPRRRMHW
ncbi:MAG TPA: rhomboid family intramembrane serine protease [Gammaproteobacteria bacterium]|nr:rhomboid family intramembrane serine protease [Gammaproteobacteria bacterium]